MKAIKKAAQRVAARQTAKVGNNAAQSYFPAFSLSDLEVNFNDCCRFLETRA